MLASRWSRSLAASNGLDRDPEPPRDLLGLQAASEQGKDLGLALGQPRRPLHSWDALPGGLQHSGDGVGVQPSGTDLPAEGLSGLCGRERRPVGPRLGHGVVGVGGGEQARRLREIRGGGSAVVARAIQPLVVEAGHGYQCGQERRAGEDALGVVGVQPDPFPVVRRERRRLLPDTDRNRHPPEIVHQRSSPELQQVSGLKTTLLARRRGQLGDTGRVADQVRRGKIGKVAHRPKGTLDRLALQGQPRARLAGERLLPSGPVGVERQEFRGRVGHRDRHGRVERAARPSADHPCGELRAPEHVLERGVAGHRGDPHRQGNVLVPGPTGQALAVPALDQIPEQALHGRGQPQTVGQHLGHLAERGDMPLELLGRPRHAPHDLHGPHRRRTARVGNCPHDPGHHLGRRPEPGR
jgi:hypothetical protein